MLRDTGEAHIMHAIAWPDGDPEAKYKDSLRRKKFVTLVSYLGLGKLRYSYTLLLFSYSDRANGSKRCTAGGAEARGDGGTAVFGASCDRAGAEVSAGGGDDGGGVGGGNDLGAGFDGGIVQGFRPGRRIVGLGVFWGAVSDGGA
jgi:hypothetical protein